MNTEMKVTTGATATTHDIELPPLPQGEYRLSPDSRAPALYDEEAMEAYARAAIEADRKKFGRNENDHMNDNDNRKRRGSIVYNASASSEPVAKIDPNPPQLSIVWHDSPESIYRAMWEQAANEAGVSYEDLIEGSNVGETEDGEVFEFTHEQAIDGMHTQGCWGFVDTKTNTINAWAADDVNAATVIHFLAHEIGHITGDQHDDDMQEEMRAEQFGRVAALAYTLWLEKKSSAPQPAEPVLVGWAVGTTGGGLLHASKYTEYEARRAGYSLPLYRLAPQQPLSESDIPAEPVKSTCKKCNGTGVESTRFHGVWPNGEECLEPIKCDQCDGFGTTSAAEPVSKTDWNNELSSWGDEDFIHIFHERPDLANRLRKMLAEPVKCIGCEGKPAPENNPCAVCGKEAESAGGLSAGQLAEILTAYIKPEIIGEALEKLENAPWELSGPVKPHLTVKYDDKGDCLYICCDSNEAAEAEENDQGILLWRAYSDGRLVGVTIPNFIGPYIKPEKVDAEASMPSDDVLDDALSNLEHDNYEQSYSGYKNRQADIALIRTALARHK